MNIDPKKVKELVLIYSELNEEYQKELMKKAISLQFKQAQLEQIQKEKTQFKSDFELQQEIARRTKEHAKDIVEMIDIFKKLDDTDKAALFMMVNQLSGHGNTVQEADISITVNQKEVSMKEYLDKHLFDADYDKAKEKVTDYLSQIKKQ